MSIELKVKAVSLQLEAQYIRKMENKQLNAARWCELHQQPSGGHKSAYRSLNSHRRGIVRCEARYTNVARAALKGTTYSAVEGETRKPNNELDKARVLKLINRYGTFRWSEESLDKWVAGPKG